MFPYLPLQRGLGDAPSAYVPVTDGFLCHFDELDGGNVVSEIGTDMVIAVGSSLGGTAKFGANAGVVDSGVATAFTATGLTGSIDDSWRFSMWVKHPGVEREYFQVNFSSGLWVRLRSGFGSICNTLQGSFSSGYGGVTPTLNVWNHIAVERPAGSFYLHLYLNGAYVGPMYGTVPSYPYAGASLTGVAIGAIVSGTGNLEVDEAYFQFDIGAGYGETSYSVPTGPHNSGGPVSAPAPPGSPAPSTAQYIVAGVRSTLTVGTTLATSMRPIAFVWDNAMNAPPANYDATVAVSVSGGPAGLTYSSELNYDTYTGGRWAVVADGAATTPGSYSAVVTLTRSGAIVGSGIWLSTVVDPPAAFDTAVVAHSVDLTVGVAANALLASPTLAANATVTIIGQPYWFASAGLTLAWSWTPGVTSSGELRITGTPTVPSYRPEFISVAYFNGAAPIGNSYHYVRIL